MEDGEGVDWNLADITSSNYGAHVPSEDSVCVCVCVCQWQESYGELSSALSSLTVSLRHNKSASFQSLHVINLVYISISLLKTLYFLFNINV